MKTRALRRLLALAISLVPLGVVACSSPESHPPILGDCIGDTCPPGQGRGGSSTSTGTEDGSTGTDSSTGTGGDSGSTGGDGGGTVVSDAGLGGD